MILPRLNADFEQRWGYAAKRFYAEELRLNSNPAAVHDFVRFNPTLQQVNADMVEMGFLNLPRSLHNLTRSRDDGNYRIALRKLKDVGFKYAWVVESKSQEDHPSITACRIAMLQRETGQKFRDKWTYAWVENRERNRKHERSILKRQIRSNEPMVDTFVFAFKNEHDLIMAKLMS